MSYIYLILGSICSQLSKLSPEGKTESFDEDPAEISTIDFFGVTL